MLEALIFDFDGLILDTETPELEGWSEVFARYGVPLPLDYFYWAVGRGAEQIERRPADFLLEAWPELDRAALVREANRLRLDGILSRAPREGVQELLAEAQAEGVRLAVASSSHHEWVDGNLERLGLRHYFERTTCADDVQRAKPYPDLYLLALKRLGLPPERALALEDSFNGATAAHHARLQVVWSPNPMTQRQEVPFALARFDSLAGVGIARLRELVTQVEQNSDSLPERDLDGAAGRPV